MTSLPTSQFPQMIDSTALRAFLSCPASFHWAYVRRLHPAEPNYHLHAGIVMAKALEVARRSFVSGNQHWLAAGLKALWLAFGPEEGPVENKNWLALSVAYVGYWDEWPPDGYLGIELIEATFALPLGIPHPDTGEELLYTGRIDWLANFRGTFYVVDEKTTGEMGQNWASQWRMRGQLLGYTYAARQMGIDCAGAIVRGICLTKVPRYCEVIIPYAQWELTRWWAQLRRVVQQMIDAYRQSSWNYVYGDPCNAYGGCPYKPLCTSRTPEAWLEYYKEWEWDPLERR